MSATYRWLIAFFISILIVVFVFFYSTQLPNFMNPSKIGELKLNEFGDFVGGILNPLLSFFGFCALLYTIHIQRKQINDDKKDREKQQFESTFFALLNVHNQVLKDLSERSLTATYNSVFMENPSLIQAKEKLKSDGYSFCHYLRILCQLLNFITEAPNESELFYSSVVRALLTDKVVRLFLIYCCCENEQNEQWQYKLLIERYEIFKDASFNKNLGDMGERINELAGTEKTAIYDAKRFYDKKAFGL